MELAELRHGTELIKRGFAAMQKGGVIMDVVNAEQARIAEEAGAVAVLNEELLLENKPLLAQKITILLTDAKVTAAMAHRFATFSKPNAAKDMATMIVAARR